jgi:hypothetical protein
MKRAAGDHRRPFRIELSVKLPDILLNTIVVVTIK